MDKKQTQKSEPNWAKNKAEPNWIWDISECFLFYAISDFEFYTYRTETQTYTCKNPKISKAKKNLSNSNLISNKYLK